MVCLSMVIPYTHVNVHASIAYLTQYDGSDEPYRMTLSEDFSVKSLEVKGNILIVLDKTLKFETNMHLSPLASIVSTAGKIVGGVSSK